MAGAAGKIPEKPLKVPKNVECQPKPVVVADQQQTVPAKWTGAGCKVDDRYDDEAARLENEIKAKADQLIRGKLDYNGQTAAAVRALLNRVPVNSELAKSEDFKELKNFVTQFINSR